jgi:hypothetical protein
MQAKKVVDFFSHLINKMEPEYTFKLVDIIYSSKHGHELCIMQLTGKNAFPKYTPEELLSDPRAMAGMSALDAVTITKLDNLIKERKGKCKVLEIDKNGTIVLRGPSGKVQRYSEKNVSSNRELLSSMRGEDAHDLGYRVGFRDGLQIKNFKKQAANFFKNKIKKIIPRLRIVK